MEQGEGIVIQAKLLFETKKPFSLDCEGDIKTFKKEDVCLENSLKSLRFLMICITSHFLRKNNLLFFAKSFA